MLGYEPKFILAYKK
jgi:DNA mismatch repair ATPase MutS